MDRKEFERLLLEYSPVLQRYIHKRIPARLRRLVEAEDVLQETFLSALRSREHFAGNTPEQLRAWLNRIASRRLSDCVSIACAILRLRERPGRDPLKFIMRNIAGQPGEAANRRLTEVEESILVDEALDALPMVHRTALRMMFREGRDIEHIASVLGKSGPATRGAVHRGLFRLRDEVRRRHFPPPSWWRPQPVATVETYCDQ